jgi:hypothetical protein
LLGSGLFGLKVFGSEVMTFITHRLRILFSHLVLNYNRMMESSNKENILVQTEGLLQTHVNSPEYTIWGKGVNNYCFLKDWTKEGFQTQNYVEAKEELVDYSKYLTSGFTKTEKINESLKSIGTNDIENFMSFTYINE